MVTRSSVLRWLYWVDMATPYMRCCTCSLRPPILMARLAICLLPVKEDSALSLGDDLSWFIEVLGFMGTDIDSAIDIMIEHFNQEKSKDLKL